MTTFQNQPLPGTISSGADATPMWQVDIARAKSGKEKRVARRSASLRKFSAPMNIRTLNDVYTLISHFEAMNGPAYSFPFLDRLDSRSGLPESTPTALDCLIGTGDGVTTAFQLKKVYTSGSYTHSRNILLPDSGTLLISVDGTTKTETTHYTVDYATGIVTFTGGNIPAAGKLVKAGFLFHCKVRYDTNDLQAVFEAYRAGSLPHIALIEVLE